MRDQPDMGEVGTKSQARAAVRGHPTRNLYLTGSRHGILYNSFASQNQRSCSFRQNFSLFLVTLHSPNALHSKWNTVILQAIESFILLHCLYPRTATGTYSAAATNTFNNTTNFPLSHKKFPFCNSWTTFPQTDFICSCFQKYVLLNGIFSFTNCLYLETKNSQNFNF